MKMRMAVFVLIVASAASARAGTIVRVEGRIVDGKGKPLSGVRIAESWSVRLAGPLEPYRAVRSAADGRFSLELELYSRDRALMAVDASGALGGLATISPRGPHHRIEIKLSPLVQLRVRYASEQPDRPLAEAFVSLMLSPGKLPVAVGRSRGSAFDLKLPPGHYILRGEGGSDNHADDSREVTLEAGKPVNLGEIRLKLSTIARLYGKPAPPWLIADARGVPKDVQPSDFKGKWVVLEFWGWWCGACVGRGLPSWMSFADDHAPDRDKFVILAVHERDAADLATLDDKLKPIVRRQWHNRPLPFPILLDTKGAMVKTYGVTGFPTAVLLDPEGRVVDFAANRPSSAAGSAKIFSRRS